MTVSDRPTVVVALQDGVLNVLAADAPVCVILVDFDMECADGYANATSPDGLPCHVSEQVYGAPHLWHPVEPEKVAEFEHVLAAAGQTDE